MEKVFNLFIYYESDLLHKIGYVVHEISGLDDEIKKFLEDSLNDDLNKAKVLNIKEPIHRDDFIAMQRLGTQLTIFEPVFVRENASQEPLCLLTPIVNGEVNFDLQISHSPFSYNDLQGTKLSAPGIMPDYLFAYMSDAGFDMPRLINDDYFLAIKLLYQDRKFVSASKLLFSCIDSLAFIEFGDEQRSFQKWIDTYADMGRHLASSDELWELRNSLLHMTNLDSRRVILEQTPRIIIYIGSVPENEMTCPNENTKFLNLRQFIDTIAQALSKWIQSYNDNPSKLVHFVKRYDLTVSDMRMAFHDKTF